MTKNSTRVRTNPASTVVIHCGGLRGRALERRVQSLVTTVAGRASVVATVTRPAHLPPSLARVASVSVVSDGGARLLERLVRSTAAVVVVPFAAEVGGDWFSTVLERLSRDPHHVGVLLCGSEHLFAFPPGIQVLDAERVAWEPISGLAARAAGGERGRPARTLGAVIIAKDEERCIASCVAAVRPLVDDVLVYDTGSSDATREIAAQHGARVVEGHWDDDFAAARNRALAHAHTDWVLSVDADEVAEGERGELGRWLAQVDGAVSLVSIVSTTWEGASDGLESRSLRLFRRADHRWEGALHEEVVPVDPAARRHLATSLPPLRLLHSGYTAASIAEKDKAARNTAIARSARDRLVRGTVAWADATLDYGRTLASASAEDAVAELDQVLGMTATPAKVVLAARVAVPAHLQERRADRVRSWVAAAAAAGESPGQVAVWTGWCCAAEGDLQGAARAVEGCDRPGWAGADLWGKEPSGEGAQQLLAEVDLAQGRPAQALSRVKDLLRTSPETLALAVAVRCTLGAGFTLEDLAREAPPAFLTRALRDMVGQLPDVVFDWLEAHHRAHPDDVRPLVAAAQLSLGVGVGEALRWSLLCREAGWADLCPLRTIAEETRFPIVSRLIAAQILSDGYQEPGAGARFAALTACASGEELATARTNLAAFLPGLTDDDGAAVLVGAGA